MSESRFPGCRIHPTALIEDGVVLGDGCAIWDNVHIRHGARLGTECIVGEKSYVAYDVRIGDYCKLNANVYVCAEVIVEDSVMISAHTVFTNDVFPRAFHIQPGGLASSEPNEETLTTVVRTGVTIGANATIGPGLTLGAFSMIGMGSVVTRDVPEYGLFIGNPARLIGYVCACGPSILRLAQVDEAEEASIHLCHHCGRRYEKQGDALVEVSGPDEERADPS